MTVSSVIKQHVLDASTLWWRRRKAIAGARLPFPALLELDQSIAWHLDGIAEAGAMGAQLAVEAFAKSLRLGALDAAADGFIALVTALPSAEPGPMRALVASVAGAPRGMDALGALLLWCQGPLASRLFSALAQETGSELLPVLFALAHAQPAPESCFVPAPDTGELTVEQLDAIGNCGRVEQRDKLVAVLQSADEQSQPARLFSAARSAALLGEREPALRALQRIGLSTAPQSAESIKLLALIAPPMALEAYLQSLEKQDAHHLDCIAAAGWSGDTRYVPWLLAQGREADGAAARAAGEAFRLITGCDLEANKLTKSNPAGAHDPQADYPLPDEDGLRRWWAEHAARYTPGVPHLLGREVTLEWLCLILRYGEQAHRDLAALHLKLARPASPLFPTKASAPRQLALLHTLSREYHDLNDAIGA